MNKDKRRQLRKREAKFEEFCRKHGLQPVHRERTPAGDILVADGFSEPLPKEEQISGEGDFPNGFYQTFWTIWRDGPQFGQTMEFDKYHDFGSLGFSESEKQAARVRRALKDARAALQVVFGDANAHH